MQLNQNLIDYWLEVKDRNLITFYEQNPHRKPPEFDSNQQAIDAILKESDKKLKQMQIEGSKKKTLGAGEAAEIIMNTVSVTFIYSKGEHSLAVYDYDKKIYTFNTNTILNDYIVQIMKVSSHQIISSVVTTMSGLRHNAAIYNPLPKYKIAVGNGIFNCLTQELEEFTPFYTVLTKISTNYKDKPKRPRYADGFTLEGMIATLSNNNPNRIKLIGQIVKAILTEHSLKPGLFIILGMGGDGKSTFFTMIANLIGQENTAYLNFGELESPDKMAETINKKLVLGLDNDVKVYLRKTALLKSIASHETITFSRKYLNAISVPFTGTFVQLCNEMPRMAESGSSMRRRLVSFKAENSHYESGTENDNIDTVYIKDPRFLEYALWYFLNEETNPYYADFNDVDRGLVNESLDAEDILSQFLSEIDDIGVISDNNTHIPSSHLYAAYQDWMGINNPGSKMLSARGFSLQVTPKLNDYGYVPSSESNIRPNSLERNKMYSTLSWGDYAERYNLEQSISLNAPSKIFVKMHDRKRSIEIRRHSQQVSPYEYFNIAAQINSDLSQSEIEKFTNQKVVLNDDEEKVIEELQHFDKEDVEDTEPINEIEQEIEQENIKSQQEDNNDDDNNDDDNNDDDNIDDNNIDDNNIDDNNNKDDNNNNIKIKEPIVRDKPNCSIYDAFINNKNNDISTILEYLHQIKDIKDDITKNEDKMKVISDVDIILNQLRKLTIEMQDPLGLLMYNEAVDIQSGDVVIEKVIEMIEHFINDEEF